MCILFVSVNQNPPSNGFKLILASNRDEFYDRKSKPAHYWDEASHILGGMDMEPGREGGTWLALNKNSGRIACLLNITSKDFSTDKRGRGKLVVDYLNIPNNGVEYSETIRNDAAEYNKFNLVMIDPLDPKPLTYYTNASPDELPLTLTSGVFGFGNSLFTTPYKKVATGRDSFESVVQSVGVTDKQDELVSGLLEVLKNPQKHYPDPQINYQAGHYAEEFRRGLSSRYVHIPRAKYGTRTHTIILVDSNNKMTFLEWTMSEPIVNSNNPTWIESKYIIDLASKM